MKICLLIVAVAALCCTVDARHFKVRRSAGYGGGYGAQKVEAPVVQMDHSAGYGAQKVEAPVVQMDHSAGYGAAPASGYGSSNTIMRDSAPITETVETIEITDPALINLCLTRSTGKSIFYLPHPTKQDSYIQCDQYGKAFLKKCPWGTIFTQNLVCENPADLHPVEEHSAIVDVTPAVTLDQTYGSYGSAPVFQNDQSSTIEVSQVEVIREAPEFRQRCLSKSESYGYTTETDRTVFYITHPTNPHFFIQCDNFGKAFLKECPMNLVFTRNLVCERIGEEVVGTVVQEVQPQVALDMSASYGSQQSGSYGSQQSSSYGSQQSNGYGAAAVVSAPQMDMHVEHISGREAPEFNELCLSKINYGGQVKQIFYIPHPSKQTFFIQCDEFGKAFVKECPVNTIFTLNHVCENIDDLHAIEEHSEGVALDQSASYGSSNSYGSYGSAPVFNAPSHDAVETHSRVEVMQEAPEFKELCMVKSNYGGQVSSVFYIPHPSNKGMYIQCNEFGNAYLKTCPVGTIFTSRLTCERVTDVFEEEPAVMRDQVQSYGSYAAPAAPEPVIMREQPKATYNSYAAPAAPEPVIMREQPKATYNSYAAPAAPEPVIMREQPKAAYAAPAAPEPVIMREQPKATYNSYAAPAAPEPVIMREQPKAAYAAPAAPKAGY